MKHIFVCIIISNFALHIHLYIAMNALSIFHYAHLLQRMDIKVAIA